MEFPRETKTIRFGEDTPWPGVVVEVFIDTPIGFFIWVRDISSRVQAGEDDGTGLEDMEKLFTRFGDEILESWDIQLKKVDVPCTGEGLVSLSIKFGAALMAGWTQAVSQVADPLVAASPNGSTSPEASAKTVKRSRSRGSSKKRD